MSVWVIQYLPKPYTLNRLIYNVLIVFFGLLINGLGFRVYNTQAPHSTHYFPYVGVVGCYGVSPSRFVSVHRACLPERLGFGIHGLGVA